MLALWIILGILGILIVVLVIWGISTYNSLIRLRTNVEEGFSTMDVYLKKRFDLVPNLVAVVKQYAKHEQDTLTKVIEARSKIASAGTDDEKVEGEVQLTKALKTLFSVAEAYPELKADSQFINLQNQLTSLEREIADARKYYNGTVKVYNVRIQVFPSVIIARMFKFEKKKMFEVDDVAERKAVKVDFGN